MKILEVYRDIEGDGAKRIELFADKIADQIGGAATTIHWGEIPRVRIIALEGRPVANLEGKIQELEDAAESEYNLSRIQIPPKEWDIFGWDLPDGHGGKLKTSDDPHLKLTQRKADRGGGTRIIDEEMSEILKRVLPINNFFNYVRQSIITGIMDSPPLLGLQTDNLLTKKELAKRRDKFHAIAPAIDLGPVGVSYLDLDYDEAIRNYGFLA